MQWLPFVAVITAALCSLIDFLLGQEGRQKNKDRLAELYVFIGGSKWTSIASFSANSVLKFIKSVLGFQHGSFQIVVRLIIISFYINATALFSAYPEAWSALSDTNNIVYIKYGLLPAVIVSLIVDTVSITTTFMILKIAIKAKKALVSLLFLALDFVLGYLFFLINYVILQIYWVTQVGAPLAFADFTGNSLSLSELISFGWNVFIFYLKHLPTTGFHGGFNYGLVFGVSALLPSLLHLVAEITLSLLLIVHSVFKPATMFVLERFDELNTNFVLTKLGVALSTLFMIIYALFEAFSKT